MKLETKITLAESVCIAAGIVATLNIVSALIFAIFLAQHKEFIISLIAVAFIYIFVSAVSMCVLAYLDNELRN